MLWYACPVCTLLAKTRALCAECAEELYRRRAPIVRDVGPYSIKSLFAWRRGGLPALNWWARALKNKEADAFWREAAVWSLDQWGGPEGEAEFVPIPTAARFNHALGFARPLALRTGATVRPRLELVSRGRQKRLDVFARRRRRFHVKATDFPRGRVIVIDDITTTGATAEAAFRALGQPPLLEVWCLMDRRPRGEGT